LPQTVHRAAYPPDLRGFRGALPRRDAVLPAPERGVPADPPAPAEPSAAAVSRRK